MPAARFSGALRRSAARPADNARATAWQDNGLWRSLLLLTAVFHGSRGNSKPHGRDRREEHRQVAERSRGVRLAFARPARQLAYPERERDPEIRKDRQCRAARLHWPQLRARRRGTLVLPEWTAARVRQARLCAPRRALRRRCAGRPLRQAFFRKRKIPRRRGIATPERRGHARAARRSRPRTLCRPGRIAAAHHAHRSRGPFRLRFGPAPVSFGPEPATVT